MSKFDYKKVMPRYSAIAIVLTLISVAVVGKALYTMTVKHDYWMTVASRLKKDSVSVKPVRGNILSCDGQLMASSLPEFRIYMDFKALHDAKNDSLWRVKLDSISKGLNQIFPNKSAAQFKKDLEIGRKQQSRHWPIWERRIDYSIFSEVKRLPIFKLSNYQGGFHVRGVQRPPVARIGSLAQRAVPSVTLFGAKDSCPLAAWNSLTTPSCAVPTASSTAVRCSASILDIMDTPPIDGADIVTTIDVRHAGPGGALRRIDELKEIINGNVGVAIVMEVKTGDVKAIVNMDEVRWTANTAR
jgi:cell division protein FtsI (penicillin-binding protein 3)